MRTRGVTAFFQLGVAASLALTALPARANGVFPTAGQIVIDPSDPAHIVVRTTYGILTTREGGEPWDWICESAVGYSSGFHPSVAITEDGTLIAGLPEGIGVSHADTCSWDKASGASSTAYVVDVSLEKNSPSHAVAITGSGVAGVAKLWTSDDNAVTWTQAGVDLPAGFVPVTVDVAPSDPMRVYVSALTGGAGTFKGSLLVSTDRGQTWAQFSVPQTDGEHAPYIGAIDPANPDRVYIRNDGTPGRLFVFDHGAASFTEIFTGGGYLRGFALSPDGATLLVGGSSDGIWRAPSSTLSFEKRSNVATRCLTWTDAGVYTCATEFADGFTVGLSKDEGGTFDAVMHLACVRGPLACAPETIVAKDCPSQWGPVAVQIGQETCPEGTTTGTGGGSGSTGAGTGGSATTGAGGETSTGATNPTTSGTGGSGISVTPNPSKGCACALAGSSSDDGHAPLPGTLAPIATVLLLARPARRRATPRA